MTIFKNINNIVYPVANTANEAERLFRLNYESVHVFLGNNYKGSAKDIVEFREKQQ